MTRPINFQYQGCTLHKKSPTRNTFETPFWDLSIIYGSLEKGNDRFRTLKGGLIKYETVEGRIWPQSYTAEKTSCMLNQGPSETRCHDAPNPDIANSIFGINLFFIYFWRLHNVIANELAEVNPCWDDQKLFDTAREINIAVELQILYYELMSLLLGKENLEKDGVLSSSNEFRDIYDKKVIPELSLEFLHVFRWFHTIQDGTVKLFDKNGTYLSKIPLGDLSFRTGYLADGNNMDYIAQGSFRQPCAAADYVVDPFISEIGLGPLQDMLDITTNDLAKTRYFGLQPYIKYREYCFGKKISCWEDLEDAMGSEQIERLKNNYESIEDIDLLAGIWLEKHIAGGHVPSTFYCITVEHMRHNIVSDRHWFERHNRPNSFTLPELLEIRKFTMASLMCYVGDSVTEIQPSAFEIIGKNNKITDCCEIPKIDFSIWKDPNCESCNAE